MRFGTTRRFFSSRECWDSPANIAYHSCPLRTTRGAIYLPPPHRARGKSQHSPPPTEPGTQKAFWPRIIPRSSRFLHSFPRSVPHRAHCSSRYLQLLPTGARLLDPEQPAKLAPEFFDPLRGHRGDDDLEPLPAPLCGREDQPVGLLPFASPLPPAGLEEPEHPLPGEEERKEIAEPRIRAGRRHAGEGLPQRLDIDRQTASRIAGEPRLPVELRRGGGRALEAGGASVEAHDRPLEPQEGEMRLPFREPPAARGARPGPAGDLPGGRHGGGILGGPPPRESARP